MTEQQMKIEQAWSRLSDVVVEKDIYKLRNAFYGLYFAIYPERRYKKTGTSVSKVLTPEEKQEEVKKTNEYAKQLGIPLKIPYNSNN